MRPRFDSRPLVMRRNFAATMRHTVVLELPTQLRHGFHLFFVICSAVIARNVANQEVLDAFGPKIMGKLYLSVAVVAGILVALAGWLGRNHDTRRVARLIHVLAAAAMAGAYFVPEHLEQATVGKYVLMEVSFATMLLVFGMMLGASLGPREARKLAGRVGTGGIVGGLVGNLLCVGALWFGSEPLYLVAGGIALTPVFFLPATSRTKDHITRRIELSRERSSVPALMPYGRWVAITTFLMVAATTLIDYQYRYGADAHYDADAKTAFFGFVGILGGCATVLFQLTVLDRLLDKVGLFGTATVMPGALIVCSAAFGLLPSLATLVVLKVVDSGSNMSLQQATGNLLLAPLSPRARAVWQGRIDGLAKRGSQLLAGAFLALFPWTPARVLPVALLVCALWIGSIVITRSRYVRLLTEMLGHAPADRGDLEVYDGSTVRLLETELRTAAPARAAVILDLLEQAGHRAPDHLLERLVDRDPNGPGGLRVIEHLTTSGDVKALILYAKNDDEHRELARAALIALADLEPRVAQHRSRQLLGESGHPESLRALAAGILAVQEPRAQKLAQKMSRSSDARTRLAVVQALGRAGPEANGDISNILYVLANDAEAEVARTAIEALGKLPSSEGCDVILRALHRREVRGAAMRALAAMGQPVVQRVAAELHDQRDAPAVAATLTWVLGRFGSPESLGALVDALDAPIVRVRLNAAVALSTLHRRRPDVELPVDISRRYMPEIQFYARMRQASLAKLPDTPPGKLLRRTIQQRAQSSLETLFRVMSLHHSEDAMQGAFQAISARDPRKRQIALELLDTVADKQVSEAIAEAVGGVRARRRVSKPHDVHDVLGRLAKDPDRFLASLASAVLLDAAGTSDARRQAESTGEIMAQQLVNQILELQSLTLFSHSSAEDLAEVASMVSARRVTKGTVLFREGEAGDAMYLLRSGEITLSRKGEIIENLGPGEACGIVAVLDQMPREYTATASMDCKLLVIRGDDLLQLLADRPLLMHSVFRALTAALRSKLDRGALGKKARDWSW